MPFTSSMGRILLSIIVEQLFEEDCIEVEGTDGWFNGVTLEGLVNDDSGYWETVIASAIDDHFDNVIYDQINDMQGEFPPARE